MLMESLYIYRTMIAVNVWHAGKKEKKISFFFKCAYNLHLCLDSGSQSVIENIWTIEHLIVWLLYRVQYIEFKSKSQSQSQSLCQPIVNFSLKCLHLCSFIFVFIFPYYLHFSLFSFNSVKYWTGKELAIWVSPLLLCCTISFP